MPEMRDANAKEKNEFFRGDELPITTVKAALTPAAITVP